MDIKRTYMTVDVPCDMFDSEGAALAAERKDFAIDQARERMRTFAIPASWYVVWDNGYEVRVCRLSFTK